jgi:hypothetical protein
MFCLQSSHLHCTQLYTDKYTECSRYKYIKINAYIFLPKRFMKFVFSALYRVTQKVFNARQYTSMWTPVVAWQISKQFSSFCHVFISMWCVISSTASIIHCVKSARSRTFLLYPKSLINPHAKKSSGVKSRDLGGQAVGPPLPYMLINMWQELEYRLDICRVTAGAHIEVYWRA